MENTNNSLIGDMNFDATEWGSFDYPDTTSLFEGEPELTATDDTIRGHVFVCGHGLVKFKSEIRRGFGEEIQYQGKIKLPKGLRTTAGKKWISHDYYYDDSQIFCCRNCGIESMLKENEAVIDLDDCERFEEEYVGAPGN